MKLLPFGDNLVIQVGEHETAVALGKFGLVLADTARDKPNNGTVIAIGHTCKVPVKIGDKILFTKYGGTPFDFEGVTLLVISGEDAICGYEDTPTPQGA